MQIGLRAVYMRGGSSKAVFFHENHLPQNLEVRDAVILAVFGSPDPNRRQIDGMGGAISSTSKVAIISPSDISDIDVNYNFGQVSIDKPIVSYKGNCGNISSAVGLYAIEEGLVKAVEPITKVRIFQVNTKKVIIAEILVKEGRPVVEGSFAVPGVPNLGAEIKMRFLRPEGAVTGKLLPTGNVSDVFDIPGRGTFNVSIVDASNPIVFVAAHELGIKGTEISEIEKNEELLNILEEIRARAAVMIGLATTPEEASEKVQSIPKVAIVSKPQDYTSVTGMKVSKGEIDITGRIISVGILHKAYTLTGAICTAGAAKIPGTVVNNQLAEIDLKGTKVRIGHPGGVLPIEAEVRKGECLYEYIWADAGRTARRLMEGYVFVPKKAFDKR